MVDFLGDGLCPRKIVFFFCPTVDGSEIRLTSWYGEYPIIYRVLYIPGGCLGFLPSTVSTSEHLKLQWDDGTSLAVEPMTDPWDWEFFHLPTNLLSQSTDKYSWRYFTRWLEVCIHKLCIQYFPNINQYYHDDPSLVAETPATTGGIHRHGRETLKFMCCDASLDLSGFFAAVSKTINRCVLTRNQQTRSIHVWLFTDIYHKNQPNEGKYTIHGCYGRPIKKQNKRYKSHFILTTQEIHVCHLSIPLIS